jgi:hypothetical protein
MRQNLRLHEACSHRNKMDPLKSGDVNRLTSISGRRMNDDLSLIDIVTRVGMSFALTAVLAVGIFMVIRFVAWVG